jgi:hypothetical protein
MKRKLKDIMTEYKFKREYKSNIDCTSVLTDPENKLSYRYSIYVDSAIPGGDENFIMTINM